MHWLICFNVLVFPWFGFAMVSSFLVIGVTWRAGHSCQIIECLWDDSAGKRTFVARAKTSDGKKHLLRWEVAIPSPVTLEPETLDWDGNLPLAPKTISIKATDGVDRIAISELELSNALAFESRSIQKDPGTIEVTITPKRGQLNLKARATIDVNASSGTKHVVRRFTVRYGMSTPNKLPE